MLRRSIRRTKQFLVHGDGKADTLADALGRQSVAQFRRAEERMNPVVAVQPTGQGVGLLPTDRGQTAIRADQIGVAILHLFRMVDQQQAKIDAIFGDRFGLGLIVA